METYHKINGGSYPPPSEGMPTMNSQTSKKITSKGNIPKASAGVSASRGGESQVKRAPASGATATAGIKSDFTSLKEALQVIQRIRLSAQQELEMVRKMRADVQRYQMETATKARSEAQQLVLKTRLSTQREIEEMVRKASEEIQKVLADIRIIRITAQEELAAQRKFTDAAKLSTMSLALKKNLDKSELKRKKQLTASK
jgi:hypothetical protein